VSQWNAVWLGLPFSRAFAAFSFLLTMEFDDPVIPSIGMEGKKV
jgi:hypothetical protein